jgi:hypothetical protein
MTVAIYGSPNLIKCLEMRCDQGEFLELRKWLMVAEVILHYLGGPWSQSSVLIRGRKSFGTHRRREKGDVKTEAEVEILSKCTVYLSPEAGGHKQWPPLWSLLTLFLTANRVLTNQWLKTAQIYYVNASGGQRSKWSVWVKIKHW